MTDTRVIIEAGDFKAKEQAISKALAAAFNRRIRFCTFVRIVARMDDTGEIEGLSVEKVINRLLAPKG